nr:hypothetical protein CFP56_18430 [Quercus suber]
MSLQIKFMTKKMMENGNAENDCRPEQFVIRSVSSANIRERHPGANSYNNKETIEAEVVEPGSHTDASVLPSSNRSGGARLLRDSNGSWIRGFSRLIGSSSCLLAELWALRDGIAMAKTL